MANFELFRQVFLSSMIMLFLMSLYTNTETPRIMLRPSFSLHQNKGMLVLIYIRVALLKATLILYANVSGQLVPFSYRKKNKANI